MDTTQRRHLNKIKNLSKINKKQEKTLKNDTRYSYIPI